MSETTNRHVHNHGPQEGPGLECRESLIGDCLRFELLRAAVVEKSEARERAALEVLRRLEWSDQQYDGIHGEYATCPECGGGVDGPDTPPALIGHRPDCALDAVLRATPASDGGGVRERVAMGLCGKACNWPNDLRVEMWEGLTDKHKAHWRAEAAALLSGSGTPPGEGEAKRREEDRRAAIALRRLIGMMARVYGEEGFDLAPEFEARALNYAARIMFGLDEWTPPESGDWTLEEEEIIEVGLRVAEAAPGDPLDALLEEAFAAHAKWVRAMVRKDPDAGELLAKFATPHHRLYRALAALRSAPSGVEEGEWPEGAARKVLDAYVKQKADHVVVIHLAVEEAEAIIRASARAGMADDEPAAPVPAREGEPYAWAVECDGRRVALVDDARELAEYTDPGSAIVPLYRRAVPAREGEEIGRLLFEIACEAETGPGQFGEWDMLPMRERQYHEEVARTFAARLRGEGGRDA